MKIGTELLVGIVAGLLWLQPVPGPQSHSWKKYASGMKIEYVMVTAIKIICTIVSNCLQLMFRLTSAAYFYVHYNNPVLLKWMY